MLNNPLFLTPPPRKPPPQKQIASSYISVLAISLTLSLTLIVKTFYALICILFTPLFAVNKEAEPKVKQIAEQVSKDLTAKIIELKLNKSVMEQFFDSLDQDEVKFGFTRMERLELVFNPVLEWMFMLYPPSRLKGDVKALPPKAISS